ncbi:MAG: ComF family protein [Ruminococcaceae bacterium]|nr:ComF family protein [Oscillospiraceae bacterium]
MNFFAKLLDLLFPPECSICRKNPSSKYSLCSECIKKYITEGFEKCSICGKQVMNCNCENDYTARTKTVIGGYSYCSLTFYKGYGKFGESDRITEKMILALKERGEYADLFADELSREVRKLFVRAGVDISEWLITYPPRSRAKLNLLGFDQCRLLAEKMSKKLGIPCVTLFERTDGEEQKSLSPRERAENADSTIVVKRDKVKNGGKYIVVDDIITTGATMSTAAKNLYFCGAAEVFPVSIAKTMLRRD